MLITLNLATDPFFDLRPIFKRMRVAMAALAFGAIVLGLVLRVVRHSAQEAQARVRAIDGEIANIVRQQQGYQGMMDRPENKRLQLETARLNQLFDQKAFSWTLVMEDLETVLPAGVKVTLIEPTLAKNGHITLHVRVLGPRDRSIELVQNLEHSSCFLQPRIVSESTNTVSGPNEKLGPATASTPTDFDLLAEYNPDSAEALTTHTLIDQTPTASVKPVAPDQANSGNRRAFSPGIAGLTTRQHFRAGGL